MNIKTVLLLGGIEVIATIDPVNGVAHGKERAIGYKLHRPLRVEIVSLQTPKGIALAVSMKPLCATTIQDSFYISSDDIIGLPMEASKQAEENYLQQTTGIQLAQ